MSLPRLAMVTTMRWRLPGWWPSKNPVDSPRYVPSGIRASSLRIRRSAASKRNSRWRSIVSAPWRRERSSTPRPLRLGVRGDDRQADVREDQIPHVAPQPALLADAERRDPERLLPHLGRLRVV